MRLPRLALTFDEDPEDQRLDAALLDVLEDAGARGTFFPIASRAAGYPALIDRILPTATRSTPL